MYNTRSSGGASNDNQYIRKVETFRQHQKNQQQQQQQQPQIIPHVATFVTQKSTSQPQMVQQNCQQPMTVSIQSLSSSSCGPQPHVQTPVSAPPTPVAEVISPTVQNKKIKVEGRLNTEEVVIEKEEIKWPPKRKTNKKEQKKRLNARIRRLVCPKSPLMVFSELYKDVPIKLVGQTLANCMVYTASIEVDGEVYTGDHVSKTQAKQKACENFLRIMLAKKMNERSEKKEESFTEPDGEDNVNGTGTSVKPKGPPQEDFPWPHFASLAMHNLIAHWELQPVAKVLQEETGIKTTPKVGGMKKFPENPLIYNPVQLLHQMVPGVKFTEVTISSNNPPLFEVRCEINGTNFTGRGSTKKGAKKECAIAAIKYFWQFDFHASTEMI